METVRGFLQVKSGGFGFVIAEGGDIFISADNKNGAFNGEEVIAGIYPDKRRGGNREGFVKEILSELPIEVVGTVDRSNRAVFVLCDDKVTEDIYIPRQKNGGAKGNDKVVVSITKRKAHGRSPEGEIIEVLGRVGASGRGYFELCPEVWPDGGFCRSGGKGSECACIPGTRRKRTDGSARPDHYND